MKLASVFLAPPLRALRARAGGRAAIALVSNRSRLRLRFPARRWECLTHKPAETARHSPTRRVWRPLQAPLWPVHTVVDTCLWQKAQRVPKGLPQAAVGDRKLEVRAGAVEGVRSKGGSNNNAHASHSACLRGADARGRYIQRPRFPKLRYKNYQCNAECGGLRALDSAGGGDGRGREGAGWLGRI